MRNSANTVSGTFHSVQGLDRSFGVGAVEHRHSGRRRAESGDPLGLIPGRNVRRHPGDQPLAGIIPLDERCIASIRHHEEHDRRLGNPIKGQGRGPAAGGGDECRVGGTELLQGFFSPGFVVRSGHFDADAVEPGASEFGFQQGGGISIALLGPEEHSHPSRRRLTPAAGGQRQAGQTKKGRDDDEEPTIRSPDVILPIAQRHKPNPRKSWHARPATLAGMEDTSWARTSRAAGATTTVGLAGHLRAEPRRHYRRCALLTKEGKGCVS